DPGEARKSDIIRIVPGRIAPAVLVVIGHAFVRQRDHAVKRAGGARVPHRRDADVLVISGIIHLVELVAAAELGADRVPQELHHLDALLVTDAVRTADVFREVSVDLWIFEVPGRGWKIDERRGNDLLHDLLDPAVGLTREDAVARAGLQV